HLYSPTPPPPPTSPLFPYTTLFRSNTETLATAAYRRDVGEVAPPEALALEIDDLADEGVIGVRVEGSDDELHRPGELWGSSGRADRKSTRLNSSHVSISYAVFCLKK